MPEDSFDRTLEQLLGYAGPTASENDSFVTAVMQRVQRQQRQRRLILLVCGLVGAVFGTVGAVLLSGKITWLFTQALSGMLLVQIILLVIAALAFYNWFMNDDLTLAR